MSRRLLLPPLVAATALAACTCLLTATAWADETDGDQGRGSSGVVFGPNFSAGLSGLHAPVATGPSGRSVK